MVKYIILALGILVTLYFVGEEVDLHRHAKVIKDCPSNGLITYGIEAGEKTTTCTYYPQP